MTSSQTKVKIVPLSTEEEVLARHNFENKPKKLSNEEEKKKIKTKCSPSNKIMKALEDEKAKKPFGEASLLAPRPARFPPLAPGAISAPRVSLAFTGFASTRILPQLTASSGRAPLSEPSNSWRVSPWLETSGFGPFFSVSTQTGGSKMRLSQILG